MTETLNFKVLFNVASTTVLNSAVVELKSIKHNSCLVKADIQMMDQVLRKTPTPGDWVYLVLSTKSKGPNIHLASLHSRNLK